MQMVHDGVKTRVRFLQAGAYRLHASSGKTSGNTPITVHAGTVLHDVVHFQQ